MYQIDISKHVKECRDNTIFLESRIYDILNEYVDVLTFECHYIKTSFIDIENSDEIFENTGITEVKIAKENPYSGSGLIILKLIRELSYPKCSYILKTEDSELFSLLKFTL